MEDTAGVIQTILVVDIVCMALLGLIYLSQRQLRWQAFCAWGLLAVLIPVLGPFLVIASRPGSWNKNFSLAKIARKTGDFFLHSMPEKLPRLFAFDADGKFLSRSERHRQQRTPGRRPGTRK
jgi:hypothetical protein